MAPRRAALVAALAITACSCRTCGPELPVGPQLPLQAGGVTISRLGRKASDAPRAAGRRGDFLIETAGARLVVGAGGASPAARRQHGVLLDLAVDGFGQDLLSGLAPVAAIAGRQVALQTRSVQPEAGPRPVLRIEQTEVGGALLLQTFIRAEPQRGVIELVTRATNRGARVLRDVQLGDRFAWPGATSFAPGLGFVQAPARAHVQWVGRRGEALSYALAFAEPTDVQLLFDRVGPTEQVALAPAVELSAGATHEWRRALIVVRGDLTDVAERAWPAGGKPVGVVRGALPAGLDWAVVEARSIDGAPMLGTRGGKDGNWRLALPAGAYRVALISAGGEDVREMQIDPAQPAQSLELVPPRAGTLLVRVRNRADQPVPARLMLRGVHPTRDPLLGDAEHETAAGAGIYVYAPHGDADVALPPGRYRVTATHGPEHTLGEGEAAIAAERGATLRLRVDRAFETPGFIACDFHLHAAPSPDSSVTLEDRIATLVAEGVELAVATDHDHVTDYRPAIEQAGHGEALATTPGVEITTFEWGHFIAFPLEATTPAPIHDGKTPIELFAELRALAPQAVLQVNHPRMEHIGYFARIGLDPHTGNMSDERGSLDFDTIEVINGFELQDEAAMDANLQEWLALIELGRRYTAVGNSDSHRLRYQWAGYPRTWVAVPDDAPKNVRPEQVAEALRAQRAIVSNGPFVLATIDGKGPGELVTPVQGHVQLVVDVRTAPWVEVNRVQALVDGQLAGVRRVVGRAGAPLRWRTTLTVPPRDSTIVVVVRGETTLVRAGIPTKPFAFTNPIYVDADGDGEWRRPTLSAPDGGVPDGGAGTGAAEVSGGAPAVPSPPAPPAP
jgi:hypothetical protein